MKNKVFIPLSLLLMIAGTYAASAQAQTRPTGTIKPPQVTTQTTPAPRNPAPAYSPGTSSPAAPNGCALQIGDGLPTQYICPGSAAGTSMSGNTNTGAASGSAGSQSLCAPWLSGRIRVSPQVAQELSRSCFGQGVNSSTQTPSGSLSAGGPKGYTNSLAPGASPAYSPQAGGEAGSFGDTAPQAVDPEAFKAAGTDPVATSMDALLNASSADASTNQATPSSPAKDDQTPYFFAILQAIVDAGDKWETTKGTKDIAGPFDQLSDALTTAVGAANGQNAICSIDSINTLLAYTDKQTQYFQELAKKSSNTWLADSGVDAFHPSTTPTAQTYLDGISSRLARVQQLAQAATPFMQDLQALVANPLFLAGYHFRGGPTTVEGCSDALGLVVSDLGLASAKIDQIQPQLSAARSVVY
jgi:hypothetical protein